MKNRKLKKGFRILILALFFLTVQIVSAQTGAFSYQGRLTEAGSPANGTRFFRFTLLDENGMAIPGATCRLLSIDNADAMVLAAITCP